MAIRGIAKQVAQAKARGGGSFVNPGEGELVVLALKDGTKPEFYSGDTFVAEFKVLSCSGFKGCLDAEGKEKPAGNAVGSPVSYICQFEDFPDTAFANCKTLILALMGESDESMAALAAATAAQLATDPVLKAACDKIMGEMGLTVWTADAEFAKAYEELVNRKTNPARGMRLKYSTYEKTTRDSKKIITLPVWQTVTQTGEEITALRHKLDGTEPKAPTSAAAQAAPA